VGDQHKGYAGRSLFALVKKDRLRRILARMLDETEFLSPYGIRALSKHHAEHPYVFNVHGQEYRVGYLPAESDTGMFGGNSNWRGPIWMPINMLLYRALLAFYGYYGDDFTVEYPTGSGRLMTLFEVAQELATRLTRSFFATGEDRVRHSVDRRSSRTIRIGATSSCSTSTSKATTARALEGRPRALLADEPVTQFVSR